ncbi:hypothetical protein KQI42_20335 [Tissierella sp. MSJ-40]|uniref:Uncharacterized protein n=1 Tax=Tissierella simiarum TaxID=2841534 RepID=A0ABS6EDW7_9FIRM|nr:hypothetical protein [Tissierella simiarum]MBU5440348.1 hypothetical protein [Tissierella simiarum]
MEDLTYKEILEISDLIGLEIVDEKRNYWLVRSKAGEYFDDFYFEGFIAIGWNKVSSIETIKSNSEDVKKEVEKFYPKEKRPGYVANQIIRFVDEMKSGDIVLVPNKDSKFVVFGELIEDDIYIEQIEDAECLEEEYELSDAELLEDYFAEDVERKQCLYIKRRKVKWIKTIKREKLDPYLFRLLYSHNTISDANEYASYIDRSLYSFFVKGKEFHAIYEVTKKEDIPAIDLIGGINNIMSSVDVFNKVTGSSYDKRAIDMKINVQSPGPVELITYCAGGAFIVGAISMFLFGGNFEFDFTKDRQTMKLENSGLLGSILKFKEQKHKENMDIKKLEKELQETKENLKLITPNEQDNNKK